MKALFIILAIVVVASGAIGLYVLSGSDKTTSIDDKKITVTTKPEEEAGLRPEPGKYSYVGGGIETVSVLGGGEHILPKQFTATTELGDGCEWTLKLYYIDEHKDTDTWCTNKDGVDQLAYTQQIKFFGSTETVDFSCTGGPVWPAGAKPGTKVKHTCSREDRAVNRDVTIGAPETLVVGKQKVQVTPLSVEAKLTGATKGTSLTRWWLMSNGQAARYSVSTNVTSDSILGKTKYTMDNEYKLESLEPVT